MATLILVSLGAVLFCIGILVGVAIGVTTASNPLDLTELTLTTQGDISYPYEPHRITATRRNLTRHGTE